MMLLYDPSLRAELPDFTEMAARELRRLGLERIGGRGRPRAEAISERVVRDYVARGVLSPTIREGRSAYYSRRHMLELLGARVLIKDGWPLAKIGEHLRTLGDAELEGLLPGTPETPASRMARTLREEREPRSQAGRVDKARPPLVASYSMAPDPASWSPSANADDISSMAAIAAKRRAEAPMLQERFGGTPPLLRELVAIEIGRGCVVHIDRSHLTGLTIDQAEAYGRALAAALLNIPHTKRSRP